jgi:hypothetical protein
MWYDTTLARIRELGRDTTMAREAATFLCRLSPVALAPPHVSLATDGELNLLWRLPALRLDLGFYGDGTYSYYGWTATGEEWLADWAPLAQRLPSRLLQLLIHSPC